MTDPKERAAFSEFRAALDLARSHYTDALKAADDGWAANVRARVGLRECGRDRARKQANADAAYAEEAVAALTKYERSRP